MNANEIKPNGIYKVTLKVQFRNEKEIKEVDFFVRAVEKCASGCIEICFLNDNTIHFVDPHQLSRIE